MSLPPDADQRVELPGQGARNDAGKPRFDLLPPSFLFIVTGILTAGAGKYAPRNWEKGMDWSRVIRSSLSHIFKWMLGEDLDSESGQMHLGHAAWGLMVLIEYEFTHKELDNRVKYDPETIKRILSMM